MDRVYSPLAVPCDGAARCGDNHTQHTVTFFGDVGESNQPLSHESASKYFTIGIVRKPCDWMLSTFMQQAGHEYAFLAKPTDESRASFKAWVSRSAFARSSMHMSCLRPRAGPRLITRALTGDLARWAHAHVSLVGSSATLHAHVSLAGARARDGRR